MAETHTPGPWTAELWVARGTWSVFAEDRAVTSGVPSEADARLIAAAPELLEALKDVLVRYVPGGVIEADDPAHRAFAAIAKATGDDG